MVYQSKIKFVFLFLFIILFSMICLSTVWDSIVMVKQDTIAPPLYKKVAEGNFLINNNKVKMIIYSSLAKEEPENVFKFLLTNLNKLGWIEKERYKPYSIHFSKNSKEMIVQIINSTIIYSIGSNLKQVKINEENPGKDLHDVPRPNNAKRILSMINEDDKSELVIYKSSDSIHLLKSFYREFLTKHNWSEVLKEDLPILIFEQKNKFLQISFYKDTNTIVIIQYFPERMGK